MSKISAFQHMLKALFRCTAGLEEIAHYCILKQDKFNPNG